MNLSECKKDRKVHWQRGHTWHAARIVSATAHRVRVLVMLRNTPVYRYVRPGRLATRRPNHK